ncbi:MAG: hypothetical protein ACREM2_00405 [Vulcanimicrobiaceae bacterium]
MAGAAGEREAISLVYDSRRNAWVVTCSPRTFLHAAVDERRPEEPRETGGGWTVADTFVVGFVVAFYAAVGFFYASIAHL